MYAEAYKCPFCDCPTRSEKYCKRCIDQCTLYYGPRQQVVFTVNVTPQNLGFIRLILGMKPTDNVARDPSRHCSACGIGTCEPGESQCEKCLAPKPMTLERAIAILNQMDHRDEGDSWCLSKSGHLAIVHDWADSLAKKPAHRLYAFEAIAIAEKYERESK